jgi:hypothetical protein
LKHLHSTHGRLTGGDSGIALIVAVALAALVGVLILVVVTVAMYENGASGRDRQRSTAVTTAEGQVDSLVAEVTGTFVGTLPCGTLAAAGQSVKSDTVSFQRTVSYFAPDGTPITDCAGVEAGAVKAGSAKIVVTSTSNALAGQSPARRTVETLVNLSPVYKNSMDKAIFGDAGVVASGNLSVTSVTKNADVYTNGDFACQGQETYEGNLTAQKTVSMQGQCTVTGNVLATKGLTGSNGTPTIGGRTETAAGNISLGSIQISGVGAARASGTATGSACATAGTCVAGATLTAPPVQSFPMIKKAAVNDYVGKGYQQVNVTDPAGWLVANGATMPSDTVLVTSNRMTLSLPGTKLMLNHNVAIFADGGFDIAKAKGIASTTTDTRNLYFIQPYDAVLTHPCFDTYGVQISNLVTMDATINDLVYTPCSVNKANHGTHQGQVYGGGTVTLANNTSLTFVLLPVWGVTYSTTQIDHYASNIVYKRENVG